MVEKTILIACVAITIFLGVSAVGSQISRLMTETECAMARKTVCIIEDPNAPDM